MTTRVIVEVDGSANIRVTVSRSDGSEPVDHIVKGHGDIKAAVPMRPRRREFLLPENGSISIVPEPAPL